MPRNAPAQTFPGATAVVYDRVGVGIVPGFDDQYRELEELVCQFCGGTGLQPGEPQPDRFGNFTACENCEDWGH